MDLKRCILYKFWALKGMRAQVRLLELLVDYWDPDIKLHIDTTRSDWVNVDITFS
jgi:hypothetical protein